MLLDCNSFESYQTNTSNMCSEIHYFTKARNTIGEIINTEICKENKPKVYFQQHMAREGRKKQRGGSKRKPTTKKGRREEREKREEERGKGWEKLRHSVLTRGALGEVVNLTKPMIESGLGGWIDRVPV